MGDKDAKKCWIVDPAWEIDKIFTLTQEIGYSIEGALLTHSHYDHCNGLEALRQKKNIPIYVQQAEVDIAAKEAGSSLFGFIPRENF